MLFQKTAEFYRIVSGVGGYAYPSGIWRRSLIGLPYGFTGWFHALQGEACLLHGRHVKLATLSERHPVLLYYRAYSLYLCGDFEKALHYASRFCEYAPQHREGRYLFSDTLDALKKKRLAFDALCEEELLVRRKTWVKLANLVENSADFLRLQDIYHSAVEKGLFSREDDSILECFAMGAQRAGEYEKAVEIWRGIASRGRRKAPVKKKIAPTFATEALHALTVATENAGLRVFLISGTLLGLVRCGDFLSHDTDLDTGIFDGFDPDALKAAIYASGCFSIMPQRSPHCLRVRHVNGTPIDIFVHYRSHGDFWHGGVKVSWHNSPFGLKKAEFKGYPVFIPDNPERYLEENYGPDWRTPKKSFDSARDCPNSRVENPFELVIHQLKTGSSL